MGWTRGLCSRPSTRKKRGTASTTRSKSGARGSSALLSSGDDGDGEGGDDDDNDDDNDDGGAAGGVPDSDVEFAEATAKNDSCRRGRGGRRCRASVNETVMSQT